MSTREKSESKGGTTKPRVTTRAKTTVKKVRQTEDPLERSGEESDSTLVTGPEEKKTQVSCTGEEEVQVIKAVMPGLCISESEREVDGAGEYRDYAKTHKAAVETKEQETSRIHGEIATKLIKMYLENAEGYETAPEGGATSDVEEEAKGDGHRAAALRKGEKVQSRESEGRSSAEREQVERYEEYVREDRQQLYREKEQEVRLTEAEWNARSEADGRSELAKAQEVRAQMAELERAAAESERRSRESERRIQAHLRAIQEAERRQQRNGTRGYTSAEESACETQRTIMTKRTRMEDTEAETGLDEREPDPEMERPRDRNRSKMIKGGRTRRSTQGSGGSRAASRASGRSAPGEDYGNERMSDGGQHYGTPSRTPMRGTPAFNHPPPQTQRSVPNVQYPIAYPQPMYPYPPPTFPMQAQQPVPQYANASTPGAMNPIPSGFVANGNVQQQPSVTIGQPAVEQQAAGTTGFGAQVQPMMSASSMAGPDTGGGWSTLPPAGATTVMATPPPAQMNVTPQRVQLEQVTLP